MRTPAATNKLPMIELPRLCSPLVLNAMRWLIWDTFRQALASRIFWIMLIVSGTCIVFCLGVSVDSGLSPPLPGDTELYTRDGNPLSSADAAGTGSISLLYGFLRVPHGRHAKDAVQFIQVVLASFVAGVLGFVLTLIWTAGFLPDFLQPNNASVLFAKPVPRWTLVVGKYAGVLTFVAFQVFIFFAGTWLALSLRTDVWEYGYLAAMPLFVIHFAVILAFTVLIAVLTRSTVACIFGSIIFWLLSWGMNIGRHFAVGIEQLSDGKVTLSFFSRALIEMGYWIFPKPADIVMMQEQALGATSYTSTLSAQPEMQAVIASSFFQPELSILASLLVSAAILLIAARQLAKAEY